MAMYTVKFRVEGKNIASLNNKIKQGFGEEFAAEVTKDIASTSRAARLQDAAETASDAKSQVEELRDELQEWLDGMPENLQGGSKAEEIQQAIDQLEEIISSLEDVDFDSVEFPGMF